MLLYRFIRFRRTILFAIFTDFDFQAACYNDIRTLWIFSRCRACQRLLVKPRTFVTFFSWRNGSLTFFFGPLFLFILAQGLFSAFFCFFHERNVNALHFYVRILSSARCTQSMQLIRNYRENYSQGTRSVTRL